MEEIEEGPAQIAAPAPYVPSAAERRGGALYHAVQSFGQHGASSVEEIVERAEGLMYYVENGVAV